jgi:hypothetical protein
LVGKPYGKGPLGRHIYRWENIMMNIREVGWEGVDWIHRAQDGGCCESGNEPSGFKKRSGIFD